MPFNIEEFRAKTSERGIQKNNKFLVQMTLPNNIGPGVTTQFTNTYEGNQAQRFKATQQQMEFWTDGANIPGIMLSLRQLLHYGYGVTTKKPIAPVFNDITFSIMNDGSADNLKYFHAWINFINNFDARSGWSDYSTVFELRYLKDYSTKVDIYQFNDSGEENLHIVLEEAYPIHVGDIPLNWADNSNLQRVPVTFTFSGFFNHDIQANDRTTSPAGL